MTDQFRLPGKATSHRTQNESDARTNASELQGAKPVGKVSEFTEKIPESPSDSEKLANVLVLVEEVLNGMAIRPAMYGTAQSLEFEFLRLLEVKEVALGLRTMENFLPVAREDLISNRWMKFVGEKFPKLSSLYLSGRQNWTNDRLPEFVGYLTEFRKQIGL